MSAAPPAIPGPTRTERTEVTIVGHSNLFYWWPVWAVGFVLAILTRIDNDRMVTVPNGSLLAHADEVTIITAKGEKEGKDATAKLPDRDVVVLPAGKGFDRTRIPELNKGTFEPLLHISHHRVYGVFFAMVLILVIIITSVPLRGMWSVLVIVGTITLVLILNLTGQWEHIVKGLTYLDIRINMGGYLFIATALFIAWIITFVFFDRQIYIKFVAGQVKICTEIGGGEKVEPASRVRLAKQPGDLFRHRILGFGSGDLVVKVEGERFDLHNVLFVGKKLQQIEQRMSEVVAVGSK